MPRYHKGDGQAIIEYLVVVAALLVAMTALVGTIRTGAQAVMTTAVNQVP